MKKLSRHEFMDRAEAIARAKKIFIPYFTNNISIAFEVYQELLAERERKLELHEERRKYYSILWDYERPKCPECDNELFMRLIAAAKGPGNIHGYKTCWECVDGPEDCYYEEYSGKTIKQWMRELKKREVSLRHIPEEKEGT